MNKKKAFTLAEILIAIAIIGVIGALTIPTVINNYQKKAYESQYKKGVNTLANGMKKLLAQEGVYDLKETSMAACYKLTSPDKENCLKEISNKTFKIATDSITDTDLLNKLKKAHAAQSSNNPWDNVSYAFVTTDGIVYGFSNSAKTNGKDDGFYIVMDTNISKSPNKKDKDLYKLSITSKGTIINKSCEIDSSCGNNDIIASNPSDDKTNPIVPSKSTNDLVGISGASDTNGEPIDPNAFQFNPTNQDFIDRIKNAADNDNIMSAFPNDFVAQLPPELANANIPEIFDISMAAGKDNEFPLDITLSLATPFEQGSKIGIGIYDGNEYSYIDAKATENGGITFTTDKMGTYFVLSEQ